MFKKIWDFTTKLAAAAKEIRAEVFTSTNRDAFEAAKLSKFSELRNHTATFLGAFYSQEMDAETQFHLKNLNTGVMELTSFTGQSIESVWEKMEKGENVYVKLHEDDESDIRRFAVFYDHHKRRPEPSLPPQVLVRLDAESWIAVYVIRESLASDYPYDLIANAIAEGAKGGALEKTALIPLPGFIEVSNDYGSFRVHVSTYSEQEAYSIQHLLDHYDALHLARKQAKTSLRPNFKELYIEASDIVSVKAGGEGMLSLVTQIGTLAKLHGYTKDQALGFTQEIYKMIHPVLDPEQQEAFTEQIVRNAISRAYMTAEERTASMK